MAQQSVSPSSPASLQRCWQLIVLVAMVALTIAAIAWIMAHPFGTNWDEASYINHAYQDVTAFREGGPLRLVKELFRRDVIRPHAYRLLILPVTLVLGASPAILRILSWIALGITLFMVYATGRRLSGPIAGSVAVLFLLVSPIVIGPNMRFYMDYALYLAIAGTYYCLFSVWDKPQFKDYSWVGLGLFMGLGALAKATVVIILGPLIGFTAGLVLFKRIKGPGLAFLSKASALAIVMAIPWWLDNGKFAYAKATRASGHPLSALGPAGSAETFLKWFYTLYQTVFGPALAITALVVLVTAIWLALRRRLSLSSSQGWAVAACVASSLPLPMYAILIGSNHNPRLIAPVLLGLGLIIGILAVSTRWATRPVSAIILVVAWLAQLTVTLTPTPGSPLYQAGNQVSQYLNWGNPTSVFRREEQWDWSQLKAYAAEQGFDNPKISYIGGGKPLNPASMMFPWVQAGQTIRVEQLWDPGQENIDWEAVLETARKSDLVVTIAPLEPLPSVSSPWFNMPIDQNRNNLAFIEQLPQAHEAFEATPHTLQLGNYVPQEVFVFVNRARQEASS
ncbi:MAG: glycosyltransferase family 39 protein [Leptolyngbya sp. SIO1D8]|nr:glycosyltransferase family 39 protein [Leptolyngbya sp. SIO1D8]